MAWLRPSSRPPGVEMPQSDLRQTVRERLASGWLFPAPANTWTGKGTGHVCIVCGITIQSSEVENEVVGPTTVWSHLTSYPGFPRWTHRLVSPAFLNIRYASRHPILRRRHIAHGTFSGRPWC